MSLAKARARAVGRIFIGFPSTPRRASPASLSDTSTSGWSGAGTDELVAGPTTDLLHGGTGDDSYRLGAARSLEIRDSGGHDLLDFSLASAGLSIDLDQQGSSQQLHANLQLRIDGELEDFVGTGFADQIFVRPLALATRQLDLGGKLSNDGSVNRVQFDAIQSDVLVIDASIQAAGFAAVTLSALETLVFVSLPTLHRPFQAQDVNNDGLITPLDALLILTRLSQAQRQGMGGVVPVEALFGEQPHRFYDVDGNGGVEPFDALTVINQVAKNNRQQPGGEAESGWLLIPFDLPDPAVIHARQEPRGDGPIPFSEQADKSAGFGEHDIVDRAIVSLARLPGPQTQEDDKRDESVGFLDTLSGNVHTDV